MARIASHLTESKHPLPLDLGSGPPGSFRSKHWNQDELRRARELLDKVESVPAGTGSFDCVVVRFANDNFAQDDRSE